MNDNTGGPAFPGPYATENGQIEVLWKQQGMTLRDWFAGKAIQPLMVTFLQANNDLLDPGGWMDGLASDAYSMADAMLRAREGK